MPVDTSTAIIAGPLPARIAASSLQPGIHDDLAVGDMPPRKGNRVFNSGFEAGPEGWTPTDGFAVDTAAAHSGRCSVRLGGIDLPGPTSPANQSLLPTERPDNLPLGIECRPFPVRPGMRYTLSAWMKAERPNTHVAMRFFEWADDVQIEEGDVSEYQPAYPVEVGAETATRWCRVGESVAVTAHVAGAEAERSCSLTYTMEDLWSRPVEVDSHSAASAAFDCGRFTLNRPGMYRVRAGNSPATGEVWSGVFPKRDRALRPDSAFGTHVTAVAGEPTNTLAASEAMGARCVRLHRHAASR